MSENCPNWTSIETTRELVVKVRGSSTLWLLSALRETKTNDTSSFEHPLLPRKRKRKKGWVSHTVKSGLLSYNSPDFWYVPAFHPLKKIVITHWIAWVGQKPGCIAQQVAESQETEHLPAYKSLPDHLQKFDLFLLKFNFSSQRTKPCVVLGVCIHYAEVGWHRGCTW